MSETRPPRIWSGYLLALILILCQLYVAGWHGITDNATLIEYGARKPNAGFPQAPWRLLASMFLHGGWLHVAANAMLLLFWGTQWARMVGGLGMLCSFLVSGVWGSLLSDIYGPEAVAVGASGGTSGLLLALLCLALLDPKNPGWYGEQRSWLRVSAAVVGLNVLMAFGLTSVAGGRLDHWAHLGGAAAGAVLGCLASRGQRYFWAALGGLAAGAILVVVQRGPSPFG